MHNKLCKYIFDRICKDQQDLRKTRGEIKEICENFDKKLFIFFLNLKLENLL